MSLIDPSALDNNAKLLFDTLLNSVELARFTLVGCNALALQIKHRVCRGFDFAFYGQMLPTTQINEFVSRLKLAGYVVHDLTDITTLAQFKIKTGENLRDFNRNYIINGIKLTFFVQGKTRQQREFYKNCETIQDPSMQFKILGLDGLKVAKILLLADEVLSPNLFDLMTLVKDHALTLDNINLFVKTLGHIDDPEHYRAVLTGIIPLDKNDEGLKPMNINFDIETIYEFFDKAYEQHDIKKASEFYSKN